MAAQLQPLAKRNGRRRNTQLSAAINVIPLVDVMLVLLIIFMVTAPMMTVGVPVELPKTQAAQMNDSVEPLVVSVNASGQTYIQETLVPMSAMVDRLKAITNNNPEAKIYVRGDQKIAYGKVMEVMGAIAAAGFQKVSLIAELPQSPTR
jgi:biopolymer transport protein TolR